ncbi:hypothetical protein TNCV_2918691 [Trichonephila clavipes]|nr:hypothetical protein TNCV_2918691 [Trichonephila clavipes]
MHPDVYILLCELIENITVAAKLRTQKIPKHWLHPLQESRKYWNSFFFATAIEKNVQQTVAAAMTIVTTCNFTFRSHPPLSRKPRLPIYTGAVLVMSSTVMLRTLKNGNAALGNHSLRGWTRAAFKRFPKERFAV